MSDLEAIRAAKRAALEAEMTRPGVVQAGDADLEGLIADGTVFVDYWAPWCGPCRMFAPVFEAASRIHTGRARFVKVNVDEAQMSAMQHQIQSIPTLMVFQDGRPVARQAGAMPAPMFDAFVRRFL